MNQNSVTMRLGIDCARKAILALNVPMLVSANSLWDPRRNRFHRYSKYLGRDIALDSSGFVAMQLYGGYRWTSQQYAMLAMTLRPCWWAQMDYCCEPEIAANRSEIERRIQWTIDGLRACRDSAHSIGMTDPMPVLQGYEPSDYIHGPLFDSEMPSLIGIGSVCRRHLHGKNGLMAVIDALDRRLPPRIVLHLFGVKGSALQVIASTFSHRSFSADSMAYSRAARYDCWKNGKRKTGELMAQHAARWIERNATYRAQQQTMWLPAEIST